MDQPPFPEVTPHTMHLIADQLGIGFGTFKRLPSIGVFNAIYLLNDTLVLRVPRNHPHFTAALAKEAIAVPAARAAGVRTPPLIAFDDTCTLLPIPYAVYERVHGETLASLDVEPTATPAAYQELGRDLARLHMGIHLDSSAGRLGTPNLPLDDPRPLPDALARAGYFSSAEARWLTQWLEQLPPLLDGPRAARFLHGDTQATNVLIHPQTHDYLALIDWGGCGWGDPVLDFSGMPLRAVPDVLAGYRNWLLCLRIRRLKGVSCAITCILRSSISPMRHNRTAPGASGLWVTLWK